MSHPESHPSVASGQYPPLSTESAGAGASLPHGVPLYRSAGEERPHPDARGASGWPHGRRGDDTDLHALAGEFRELRAELAAMRAQPPTKPAPAAGAPWTVARIVSAAGAASLAAGMVLSALAWLGAPLPSPGANTRRLEQKIDAGNRSAAVWRRRFDDRLDVHASFALSNALSACRALKELSEAECFRTFRTSNDSLRAVGAAARRADTETADSAAP